ncbi:MAG: hypothetical protein HQL69_21570 [Magnetococcales bacterium]|nr:hypothetical protein [Magnetococcales bacterium]
MAQETINLFTEQPLKLAQGSKKSTVTLTRVVTFEDNYYGEVKITTAMLNSMVANFNANVYGQKISIDVAHNHSNGAAGHITKLFVDGDRLRGEVDWTTFGIDAIQNRGFSYLSVEFAENYKHPETGEKHGCTLFGAGLTVRPRVKNLDPVELADNPNCQTSPCLVTPDLLIKLSQEDAKTMKKYLEELRKKLEKLKLSETVITGYLNAFKDAAKQLGEDEAVLANLVLQMGEAAEAVSKTQPGETPPTINLSITPATEQNQEQTEETMDQLLERKLAERDEATRLSQQSLEDKKAQYLKLITDADGLSEDTKTKLSEAVSLITATMGDDQIVALADNQIKLGQEMEVNSQLAMQGFNTGAQGSVRMSMDSSQGTIKLQENINDMLKLSSSFAGGGLLLQKEVSPFVALVLSEYDRINEPRLAMEQKFLANGETGIGDTNLPAGFVRTVIKEALSDLRVLELVQTLTDFSATQTTSVPYEVRDVGAAIGDGIVFEGQEIQSAGVSQEMDLSYILPMKLALQLTNEVIHFTKNSAINWDAYARNVASNSRVIRELIVRRICNELQRVSDQYGATDITDEDISGQLNGTTVHTVKCASFPIVRPHQRYNLKGETVGAAENPLVIELNSTALEQYNPAITQSAGTYYRILNYNLGYIQYVDETGTPVTPAASAGDDFISYSAATNVKKFDLDIPVGSTEAIQMNGLLQAVGSRKAIMAADRYALPNYMLMSPVLNDKATNAETYSASAKRDGAETTSQGDLSTIKAIPAYSTNAPGVDLGDERILMGVRGQLTYTVAKPFQTGTPFEAVVNNKPIGKKVAYGEEYNSIHVPVPLRKFATSVIAYSYSTR